jgi:hypothetical protein
VKYVLIRQICWLLLIFASLAGCRASTSASWKFADLFDLEKSWPWQSEDVPEPEVPTRVVCAWTETVMTRQGSPAERGFGGRLHFYNDQQNEPVCVAGQLVVYAFDENDRDPTDNRPTKRYVFPAEQLARHMSSSDLGPSYSFWLPWDQVGGPRHDVSLICRFEPVGGPLIVSEQTRHRLPGPTHESVKSGVVQTNAQLPVSNDSRAAETSAAHSMKHMTTTSISLPSQFARP